MCLLLHKWRGRSQQTLMFLQVHSGCQVFTLPFLLLLFLVWECTSLSEAGKRKNKTYRQCWYRKVKNRRWHLCPERKGESKNNAVPCLAGHSSGSMKKKNLLISFPGCLQILDKCYFIYKIQKKSGKREPNTHFFSLKWLALSPHI